MEREIRLSSYNNKKLLHGSKPGDFTVKFNKPIVLDPNKQYAVALNKIVNMSFTWHNIEAERNNQLITYSSDGGKTYHDITFPDGVWQYKSINKHISRRNGYKTIWKKGRVSNQLDF